MSFDNSKNISYLVHNQRHKWLCILLTISILICSASPVFAIGPNSTLNQVLMAFEAGKNVGEMFALLMGWNQTGTSVEEAILISIAAELQYIFDNSYGYDIVNPYSGVSPTYHVTGKSFGQMLADLNNSLATFGLRYMYNTSTGNSFLYDLYLLTGRMEIILGGANGNNITAISAQLGALGQMLQGNTQNGYLADNIVPTLNSIDNSLSNLNTGNNVNWKTLTYSPNYYDHNMNVISYSDYANIDTIVYVDVPNVSSYSNSIIHVRLPISYAAGNYNMNVSFEYQRNSVSFNLDYISIPSFLCLDIYYICPIYANNTYIKLTSNSNIRFTTSLYSAKAEYLLPDSEDYNLYYSLMKNRKYNSNIVNALDNVESAINNLDQTVENGDFTIIVPVLNPDVEFNMDVDLSVGDQDDITDLVNDTKDLTETGVTVQQLLDTLDDVLELFFNQTNKNTVETISTQYHTYY